MLIKLYKRDLEKTFYWEAWDEDSSITIHFGELGDLGETVSYVLEEFQPPDVAIDEQAKDARQSGFSEISHEELFELVIRYPEVGEDTDQIVDKACQVENLLNECLGWTGNGHCDGHEISEEVLNVYCFAVDPRLALPTIKEKLSEANQLDQAIIAYHDNDESFVVLWPEDFHGVFDY